MVDTLTEYPLQPLVDEFECRYFVENATGDCATLNLAMRSPFTKLYALNRGPKMVLQLRQRFLHNDRVQIFAWTHDGSWAEVVRLVPFEAAAVFWMHGNENLTRALLTVARLRPRRHDVLIVEPGAQRGIDAVALRCFGRTHEYLKSETGVNTLKPGGENLTLV